MKYQILIKAHVGNECMTILNDKFSFNIMVKVEAFLDIIRQMIPTVEWLFDDGDTDVGSNYCQYVCYTDKNDDSKYLLATFSEIDDKGFVKL